MRAPRRLVESLLIAALFLAKTERASAAGPAIHRYAVVIGSNRAADQALETLSFADDDALANCELLVELGMQVTLFTEPDAATRRRPLGPGCTPQTPFKRSIETALRDLVQRVKGSPPGDRNEIFFWFSGHGNGSALFVQDQPITTLELRDWLLVPTQGIADVHLILDACGARSFVTGRDGKPQEVNPDIERSVRAYPKGLDLGTNSHVGALIATTARGKAHEWSRIHAGILSHELRSALRNAADATHDRQVTYREAQAFVWAANHAVTNDEARMYGEAFPPHQGQDAVLADWTLPRDGGGTFALSVPGNREVHFWITDGRGLRILETHTGHEQRPEDATLVFLPPGQDYELSLVGADGMSTTRWSIPSMASGVVDITQLRPADTDFKPRGDDVETSLAKGLFSEPFDNRFFQWYRGMLEDSPDRPWFASKGAPGDKPDHVSRATGPLAWWLLGGAGAAAVFGTIALVESNQAYSNYRSATAGSSTKASWESQTKLWDWTETISFVAAGAAAAGSVGLLVFDRPVPRAHTSALRLTVSPLPFEVDANVRF